MSSPASVVRGPRNNDGFIHAPKSLSIEPAIKNQSDNSVIASALEKKTVRTT